MLRFNNTVFTAALFVLMCFPVWSYAQYTIIGQNSYWGSNTFGPMTTNTTQNSAYNRHAYIYPEATLGVLQHGDSIRSLEFFKSSTAGFLGDPQFRIYLNNSILPDYGSTNLNWVSRTTATGAQKVFDGDPTAIAAGGTGWKRFTLDRPYVYDTTRGRNLEILVEFIQDTAHAVPVTWVYENNLTVPQFVSNNETKFIFGTGTPAATTNNSNLRKPYIRINFFRHRINLSAEMVYALGRVPTLMGSPDTVRALISNAGLDTVRNHPVYLHVRGANHFLDSTTVSEIPPFESRIVKFSNHQPDTQGRERLTVVIGKDGFAGDDTSFIDRLVNYNVYSHADPFTGMAGGIGFQGSTGDFVARFHSDSISHINQVKVEFGVLQGLPFQIGIWETDSNGLPGKNIFSSDTLKSVIGNYILPVLPRVQVRGDFFVGLRQTDTNNIAFAYQPEIPVRPDAFYFTAPLGNNVWTPFSPGYDFKFNIQPRIQVAHDVGILRVDYPAANDTIEYDQFDSIGPAVTIVNYGFNDQKAPFDVVCEIINPSNSVVYRSVRTVTLKSNDSLRIRFDSSFSRNNLGRFTLRVHTKLSGDLIKDNDTLYRQFDVVIRHDLAVERFFDPINGAEYEMNSDSIWPIVRLVNNGIRDQRNVLLTLQLVQNDQVLHQQEQRFSLAGKESLILDFDTLTLPKEGIIYFLAFVSNHIDSFPTNDTARIYVNSIKANDIGIQKVNRPVNGQRFALGNRFQPFVEIRNLGSRDQDSFHIIAQIFDAKGSIVYADTNLHSLIKYSTTQSIFNNFTLPATPARYRFRAIAMLSGDQDWSNDTLETIFWGVHPRDLVMLGPSVPAEGKKYLLTDPLIPVGAIQNLGLSSFTDSTKVYVNIFNLRTGSLEYRDSVMFRTNLAPDSSSIFSFGNSWLAPEKGTYTALFYSSWSSDQLRANDTVEVEFRVIPALNASMQTILSPSSAQRYEMNRDPVVPEVLIRNDGYSAITDSIPVELRIQYMGTEQYRSRVKTRPLSADSFLNVQFPAIYVPAEYGEFNVQAWVDATGDNYSEDDTINMKFNSAKSDDVGIERIEFPTDEDEVIYNQRIAPKGVATNLGESDQVDEFPLRYEIWRNGDQVFRSDRTITLDSGKNRIVTFDSVFFPRETGIYETIVFTQLADDQDLRNDTLRGQFTATFGVGIHDAARFGVQFYPNPVRDLVVVSQEHMRFHRYDLFEISGKRLQGGKLNDLTETLDLTAVPAGNYLMLLSGHGELISVKLEVLH
ncbi:MAG: hypothetical protein H6606_08140 [Flavobacteriales bacterium]|nr:hypothetical protein [Flavobacteriales bacterium]